MAPRFTNTLGVHWNQILENGVLMLLRMTLVAIGSFACLLATVALANTPVHYLASIQQRWDASDIVCTGKASAPSRTGQIQNIDGSDRDELAAHAVIERCFKGELPERAQIRVIGYDVVTAKGTSGGFAYAGPPTGFLSEGRNLLFLRRSKDPEQFQITVPIFATAIHLADVDPNDSPDKDEHSVRDVVVRELEQALIQFGSTDLTYIDYLFGYLGTPDGIDELSKLSSRVSLALQRDLAVAILSKDHTTVEPVVIALLLDKSAPTWKRENAAGALGEHGTKAALAPLQEIASDAHLTNDQESLKIWAVESLSRAKARLSSLNVIRIDCRQEGNLQPFLAYINFPFLK